jgi:hypothetical protein
MALTEPQPHRPTPMPTAMEHLLLRSSRATGMVQRHQQLQAAMVQQHQQQAGLTQAPAPQQGTAQRSQGTALPPAVLRAAMASSSSLSRRHMRLLRLQCLLLVLAGMAQQLAMAAAPAMVKQGMAATDSNSSRRSRPSRCIILSALHLQRRLVVWIGLKAGCCNC